MPPVFIPFDGWSPGGGYIGEGWASATNLYPFYSSWRPWRKFVASANSLAGEVTGRHTHIWMSGSNSLNYSPDAATLFAGDLSQLYTIDPATGAWTNISGVPTYALSPAGGWRFVSVGNDIWATNWLYPLQRRTNNAGNFANGITSAFSPLPRFLATVREHMVVANLANAGRFQDELAWSDADNATNFDPPTGSSTSIAGSKRLVSIPGQITGLVGGQYGLAFKRTAIYYLEYTSSVQVFRPDVLSPHVGTGLPSSIISSKHGLFFIGPDGIYQISGLAEPQKISSPSVDQFLLDSIFSNQPATMAPVLEDLQAWGFQATGFPLVGWLIHRDWANASSEEAILYNPVTQAWANVTFPVPWPAVMFELPRGTGLYDTLAAVTYNGALVSNYAPLANSGVSANINAPTLQLRFRPANWESARPEQQSFCKGILPMFSKTSVSGTPLTPTVTVERMIDPFADVWETPEVITAASRNPASGYYPFRSAARLFRITIQCAAEDFANFLGAYIDQDLIPQ